MAILGFIVFGLIVGLVARLIVPGRQSISLVMTAILGMVGSLIGGLVANTLGTGDWDELNVLGALVAFVSAAVLVAVYAATQSGSRRESLRH